MRKILTATEVVIACAIPTATAIATADHMSAWGGFGEWPVSQTVR